MEMKATEFDQVIEEYHRANSEFAKGNPGPLQQLFSHRDDVTLLDPSGGMQRGWEEVARRQERNASLFRDAEPSAFERIATYVTPELASIVEVERHRARVGGSEEIVTSTLRVTTLFRPEEGTWKVVHRHADPVNAPRLREALTQQ
jgi:ketosteroid isomerase-like protein